MIDLGKQFPAMQSGHCFLDNAAMAQMPQTVAHAMHEFDLHHRANIQRSYHNANQHYNQARFEVARFMGAKDQEIIFTSGCTASLNLCCHLLEPFIKLGDNIVVTAFEHHANYLPWHQLAKRQGAGFQVLSPEDLTTYPHLLPRTKIVAVTLGSNVSGEVPDLAPLIHAARQIKALIVVDASQYIVHHRLDVTALDIDFIAFSGHKLYGPTGIGVLWGRAELLAECVPHNYGGGMFSHYDQDSITPLETPQKFEAGTPPITAAIGLAKAINWLETQNHQALITHELGLLTILQQGLDSLKGVKRIRTTCPVKLPIVSFYHERHHPHDLAQLLYQNNIYVRAGFHCALPYHQAHNIETGTVRVSLAAYNQLSDIDKMLDNLAMAIRTLD